MNVGVGPALYISTSGLVLWGPRMSVQRLSLDDGRDFQRAENERYLRGEEEVYEAFSFPFGSCCADVLYMQSCSVSHV